MENDSILRFSDVSYRYESDNETPLPLAIKNINIDIKKGEFVAILGHNGSGKSTIAKLSNAIILPETGKIFVDGMDTADENLEYEIRQKVGVVFQNPDNQIVATIVEEDVAFGPENLGIEPAEIRQRVDNALKSVGMYEYRLHEPHKLSGGQKQRVAIAGVMAMQTDCIVLDEPTAMLDPKGREEVMKTIIKLNRENGITVILITHFMNEAALADEVVVMDKGNVKFKGTPKEVFAKKDELTALGLSVPQSAMLIHELKKHGIDIKSDAITIEECVADIISYFKGKREGEIK